MISPKEKHADVLTTEDFQTNLKEHLKSRKGGLSTLSLELSEILNKKVSSKVLSNKLSESQEHHHLTLSEFILIMKTLEAKFDHLPILSELLQIFGLKLEKINSSNKQELSYRNVLNSLINWDKERSEVHEEIRMALEDGRIGSNELRNIRKEMNDDIIAMTKLEAMLAHACQSNSFIK